LATRSRYNAAGFALAFGRSEEPIARRGCTSGSDCRTATLFWRCATGFPPH